MRVTRSMLVGAFVLCGLIWVGGDVLAQGPADPRPRVRFQYAAKFVCGDYLGVPAGAGVLPGSYATAINIHNPNAFDVAFRDKVALTFPVVEGNVVTGGRVPGAVSFFSVDQLGPDQAIELDCEQIPSDFQFPPSPPVISPLITFHKGFLVIESRDSLDVTAVYTATSGSSGGRSLAVEQVPERRLN